MTNVVLDSNVLISAIDGSHLDSNECVALLRAIEQKGINLSAPVTQLWELMAFLHHPERSKAFGINVALGSLDITYIDVTHALFASTQVSAMTAIKGPDRVFVSLAKSLSCPLVTNDGQVLKNAANLGVEALSVPGAIARWS